MATLSERIKGRWARYYKEIPDRPRIYMDAYSLNRVQRQWGTKAVRTLLETGKLKIGYYEWLELEI